LLSFLNEALSSLCRLMINLLQVLWEIDTEEQVREDDLDNFNLELDSLNSVCVLPEEQEVHQSRNIAYCLFLSLRRR